MGSSNLSLYFWIIIIIFIFFNLENATTPFGGTTCDGGLLQQDQDAVFLKAKNGWPDASRRYFLCCEMVCFEAVL